MATASNGNSSCLRFADFAPLPKRMLAPIEGYEEMPLVSLEEAVKPLVNLVPKVERNVYIVKENCQNPADGLTVDESASIMLYTYESTPQKNSLYIILNETLRSEDRQKLVPWFSYLRLILTALARLPSKRYFANRGVRKDLLAEYPDGGTFIWWGFSSCTSSVKVLESEQFFGKSGTRTLFQIDCHTGKDIRNHSFIQKEDEILLLPARKFRVKSSLDSGNGLHIIQIEETDPKYPLLEPVPDPEPRKASHPGEGGKLKSVAASKTGPSSQPAISKSFPTIAEFAEPSSCEKLYCEGRPCAKCHKCRDWHFKGDQATWDWLCNFKTWKDNDWQRWRRDAKELMVKRDGATCALLLDDRDDYRDDDDRDDYLYYYDDYLHLCLCELH